MEKDIVAVILNLCAKKYLKLFKLGNKYFIKVRRYNTPKINICRFQYEYVILQ